MPSHIIELIQSRELLFNWARREFRVRYSQSVLGAAWAILQPFALMIITTIVFSVFLKVPSKDVPYPIFVYSGLLPWVFFANSLSSAIPSVADNFNLVSKIYFPREILPLSSILVGLVDFAFASTVFVALLIFYHIPIGPAILLIPLVIIVQFMLIIGITLFAASINVFYRDIRFLIPLTLQLWMYLTPVFYTTDIVPNNFRGLYFLNPMATLVDTYRRLIFYNEMPDWPFFLLTVLMCSMILVLSYRYFKKVETGFADLI